MPMDIRIKQSIMQSLKNIIFKVTDCDKMEYMLNYEIVENQQKEPVVLRILNTQDLPDCTAKENGDEVRERNLQ